MKIIRKPGWQFYQEWMDKSCWPTVQQASCSRRVAWQHATLSLSVASVRSISSGRTKINEILSMLCLEGPLINNNTLFIKPLYKTHQNKSCNDIHYNSTLAHAIYFNYTTVILNSGVWLVRSSVNFINSRALTIILATMQIKGLYVFICLF